jgi:transcription initiation factor TFIIE subunit alpha
LSISSEAVDSDKSFNELIGMAKEIVKNMFGEAGEKILDYLVSNGYIAEERIATSIDVRSNEARKILQRLSDEALVVPDRLKD